MKFQRISDWSRRHHVMAGSIGFLVVIILIFLAFDSYTRIRLVSEIRALERMGIPCDIEGFAERQRMRGNSREVFEEFLAHCRALSTENFPAPDASSPYRVLEPNDLSQFLVGRAEEIQAADRFLEEHSGPVLWYDFESAPNLLCMDLTPLYPARQYMRLNHDRFFYALSRNDPDEAVRNFDRSAILRDYLLQEPYILNYLLALSMELLRQQTLLDAAGNGELEKFNSATLKRWGDSMIDVEAEFRRQLPSAMEENFAWLAEMIRRPGLFGHLITGAEAEVWRDVYACLFGTLVRLDGILILEIQEDLVSLPLQSLCRPDADTDRVDGFLPGHSRLFCHVFCPVCHLVCVHHGVRCHADIYGKHIHPGCPAHQAGRGESPGKIVRDHGCDAAVCLGDTLLHHTVVRTHDDEAFFVNGDIRRSGNTCHLYDSVLQSSQAKERLGDGEPPLPALFPGRLVGRGDLALSRYFDLTVSFFHILPPF